MSEDQKRSGICSSCHSVGLVTRIDGVCGMCADAPDMFLKALNKFAENGGSFKVENIEDGKLCLTITIGGTKRRFVRKSYPNSLDLPAMYAAFWETLEAANRDQSLQKHVNN